MKLNIYHFLHVLSVILLTGFTLYAAGNPQPALRKKILITTGILSLVVVVGGAGMMAVMGYSWLEGWVIVKIIAWLFLSSLAGMAYRKSQSFVVAGATLAAAIAVFMVYFRPF